MRIQCTFSDTFDELYNKINQHDQGRSLLEIDGIDRRALDIGQMSHLFFTI